MEIGQLEAYKSVERHRITLPTAAMVRRASSYGLLVTFLDLLRGMYGSGEPEG